MQMKTGQKRPERRRNRIGIGFKGESSSSESESDSEDLSDSELCNEIDNAVESEVDEEDIDPAELESTRESLAQVTSINDLPRQVNLGFVGSIFGQHRPVVVQIISKPWRCKDKQSVWVEDCSIEGKGQCVMSTWKKSFSDFQKRFELFSVYAIKRWTPRSWDKEDGSIAYEINVNHTSKEKLINSNVLRSLGGMHFNAIESLEGIREGHFVDLKVVILSRGTTDQFHVKKNLLLTARGKNKIDIKIECHFVSPEAESYQKVEPLIGNIVKIRSAEVLKVQTNAKNPQTGSITVRKPIDGIKMCGLIPFDLEV